MTDKTPQWKSDHYWTTAQTTYLAAADYYDKQETALREILHEVGQVDRIGDVGCGDGRYTLVALDFAKCAVDGYDINSILISKAEERLTGHMRKESARFSTGSFAELAADGPFDIVMCLGVLSAVIDEGLFESALDHLVEALQPNGTLLTKDTLVQGESFISEQGEYVAIYRSLDTYLTAFANRGLVNTGRTELIRASGETSNAIYRFSASR